MEAPIYVTKTFLPPIDEYIKYLSQIWENVQLTNVGPLHQLFEDAVSEYLDLNSRLKFVTNGTLALQLALRVLDISEGEIITTPFSYVATTSAVLWEHCTPVFVDIDEQTLNINPKNIEAAITPKTKAILGVHVFGNPCDVEMIQRIADEHSLKVIYDAAHAFAVRYKGKSILEYGDISILSFHATKLFHTIEGGAVIVKNDEMARKVDLLSRFGHDGDNHKMLGINAKASEFQAAMGLVNLHYVDQIIAKRKSIIYRYDEKLRGFIRRPAIQSNTEYNSAYYPIILKNEEELVKVVDALKKHNVFPRRYFSPSLNNLPYLKRTSAKEVSDSIASRILCLPLYDDLAADTVDRISEIVITCLS